ncbi:NfeD family protein [Mucisphaera sp.]|uniref:NfeD family protein n=1 Tax=Mucisphaera sp. TaxID=2913024 RepID=UPI003D13D74A
MNPRPLLLILAFTLLLASALAQTTTPTTNTVTASTPGATPATNALQPVAPKPTVIPPGGKIAILPIQGVIRGTLEELIKRRTERALAQGATVIVFELDTPGGELVAALRISRYIKSIPVPTVAWINPDAYSAGILIASAADELVMATSATIGDSAPISPIDGNLGATERAKALSPLLAEFRDNATRNGYDYAPFHAMCVLGVEVYLIENPETGERRLVNQIDYQLMVHGSPTLARQLSQGLQQFSGNTPDPSTVGEPTQEIATNNDLGKWLPVNVLPSGTAIPDGRIHDGRSLLTIKDIRARDIGLSRATIDNTTALMADLQAADLIVVNNSYAEAAALFLSQWWVRGILIAIFLIGVLLELAAPGLSLPGLVAVLALAGLFGAPLILGLAAIWHLILFAAGLLLLVTDLLFLIGFGFLGAAGLAMMVVAIVVSVLPSGASPLGVTDPAYWNQLAGALAALVLGGALAGTAAFLLSRFIKEIPLINRLVLNEPQPIGPPSEHIAGDEVLGVGTLEVGHTGTVASAVMRPAGEVEILGQRIDAVTDGEFLTQGTPIKITEIHGNRIVVAPINP